MTISKVKGTWSTKLVHSCKALDDDLDTIVREWNPWRGEHGEYWEWQYVLSTGCSQDEHSFNVTFCPHCGVNLYDEEAASRIPSEELKP